MNDLIRHRSRGRCLVLTHPAPHSYTFSAAGGHGGSEIHFADIAILHLRNLQLALLCLLCLTVRSVKAM
jgi:hypothetical protein